MDEEKLLRCGAREFANEKRDDVSDNLLLASFLQLLMLHKMEVLLTNLLASMDIGDAFLQVDLKCEPRTRVCHPQEPSWTKTGSTILVLVLQKLLGGKV